MAIKDNKIMEELILHSDRGIPYTSYRFTNILKSYKGLVKTKYEQKRKLLRYNAVAESFFKSLKVTWVYKDNNGLRLEAQLLIFQWIETWYNRRRI